MDSIAQPLPLHDLHPPRGDFRADVERGLAREHKRLPSMYFYDDEGSRLFDDICRLEEYYPTRTEMGILEAHGAELAALVGSGSTLVELGSGSSDKTTILLRRLQEPHSYVPVDIARAPLSVAAQRIARTFPRLQVLPVCADFMREFALPAESVGSGRRVVFFPGSTIGNFNESDRRRLYERVFALCGPSGAFLIGFDLQKDRTRLERAYNDDAGVTAAFNLNLLRRINRELGADFDVGQFQHRAHYDALQGRIEMHLVSRIRQRVSVGDRQFEFRAGETVCTEHSYKFTVDGFLDEVRTRGFARERVFVDAERLFAVALLRRDS
jgi:dimethylhistidine N-methyltransferase